MAGTYLTPQGICITKNDTLCSVGSVHRTHLMLEHKLQTRMHPPYHTTYLMQPDGAPNFQEETDAAPNTQDATWCTTNYSGFHVEPDHIFLR